LFQPESLALQVSEDLILATTNRPTTVVAIYGGKAYEGQVAALEAEPRLLSAPRDVCLIWQTKIMSLSNVTFMVLDEADEMLDLGFCPMLKTVLINPTAASDHVVLGHDALRNFEPGPQIPEPPNPHPRQ